MSYNKTKNVNDNQVKLNCSRNSYQIDSNLRVLIEKRKNKGIEINGYARGNIEVTNNYVDT